MAVLGTLTSGAWNEASLSIARDAAATRPEVARQLLEAAVRRLDGKRTPTARDARQRLLSELAALRA